jgi:peptide deformylase
MSKLKIQTGVDNAILREISKPIKKIDKAVLKLISDMKETMVASVGVGLAAPQVGKNIRLILVILNVETDQQRMIPMINPEIIFQSVETCFGEEGCLSVPKVFQQVRRFQEIKVKFLSAENYEQMLKLSDYNARVVQHEIDHLDGILFVDRIEKTNKVIGANCAKIEKTAF